jgi:uncharacterized C2H2 Zn-finger protein
MSEEDIDKLFNPKKYKLCCTKCNKVFSRSDSLVRHNNESKCNQKVGKFLSRL